MVILEHRHATNQSYSRLQIGLHWVIAALIVANYLISEGMEDAFDGMMEGGAVGSGLTPNFHVWAGVTVLFLVVVRFVVRLVQGAPQSLGNGMMDQAAIWGHRALYALMFVGPALGAISWFGGIDVTAELHAIAVNALMLLALGHAAIALVHQFVFKDGTLMRMIRPR